MTYIFLDTCAIIDCAYSRKGTSPSLLEKLLSLCGTGDLKLLLSEVVLLELERAAKGAADSIVKGLVEVSNQVNANSRDGRVSNELATEFEKEIREAKNAVKDRADRALDKIRGAAKDAGCSALVSLDATDVLEATKIAVAGEKPSKSKGKWGLLQGDCLIVAGLERFVRKHGEDRVVLCSSNTSDFSVCSGGVRRLHPDIAKRLVGVTYYANPAECINRVVQELSAGEQEELAQLGEAYERVTAERMAESALAMGNALATIAGALDEQRMAFEEGRGFVTALQRFAETMSELYSRAGCGPSSGADGLE